MKIHEQNDTSSAISWCNIWVNCDSCLVFYLQKVWLKINTYNTVPLLSCSLVVIYSISRRMETINLQISIKYSRNITLQQLTSVKTWITNVHKNTVNIHKTRVYGLAEREIDKYWQKKASEQVFSNIPWFSGVGKIITSKLKTMRDFYVFQLVLCKYFTFKQ